jgi:hypothetical protein
LKPLSFQKARTCGKTCSGVKVVLSQRIVAEALDLEVADGDRRDRRRRRDHCGGRDGCCRIGSRGGRRRARSCRARGRGRGLEVEALTTPLDG